MVRRVHDPANASALLQVHRAALTGGTGGSSETTNTGNNANIDTHSHFAAGLAHWRDTNATAQFSAFLKDVTPLSRSFHELMFNKDEVVAVLVKHLSVSDSQAQEPLVELLSLLAYDLRAEVYPHFPAFVNALAGVLRGAVGKRDAKVIEVS